MSDALRLLASFARLAILFGGLLGPGAFVAWGLGVPRTMANCFVGSTAVLYALVVTATLSGVPITATTLGAGTAVISAALALLALRRRRRSDAAGASLAPEREPSHASWLAPLRHMGGWTPVYVALVAIAVLRAVHEPLAGPDVNFRWSFLAEQMLRYGTLDFYPPRTGIDFTRYFWVENIPPGIAALYAWTYVCAGKVAAIWTVPVVLIQYWSLHELTWRGALRLGGERTARFACLLLAATPLLTWSVLLGQETGLTTLSLLGLLVALLEWRQNRRPGWAVMAGLFGLLGAIAREYGLVFPVLALAGLTIMARRSAAPGDTLPLDPVKVPWTAVLLATLPLSLVWPVRAFVLTGNPVYSLPVASLPTNRLFVSWIESTAATFGPTLRSTATWASVARYLVNYAPGAILGWLALPWLARRERRLAMFIAIAVVVVLELWLASIPYTNGGLFYTMRVASPALALGALAGGWALARPQTRGWAVVGVGAIAFLTLPAALALPRNPWIRSTWKTLIRRSDKPAADTIVALIRSHGWKGPIASDASGYQKLLAPAGVAVVPLWSPPAACLVDPRLTATAAAKAWRAAGLHYLIVTDNPVNRAYFAAHAHWGTPAFRVRVVAAYHEHILLEIEAAP